MIGSGPALWSSPQTPLFYVTVTLIFESNYYILFEYFLHQTQSPHGCLKQGRVVYDNVAGHGSSKGWWAPDRHRNFVSSELMG